jgi:ABC-type Na+ efflux pump permease subunit
VTRILTIAWREFAATVLTKGFLIGLIIPPIIMLVAIPLVPLLMSMKPPPVKGTIALLDRSNAVQPRLLENFSEKSLAERAAEDARRAIEKSSTILGKDAIPKPGQDLLKQAQPLAESAAKNSAPTLSLEPLPPDSNLDDAKEPLKAFNPRQETGRLAVLLIHDDAVSPKPGSTELGAYDFFIAPGLDSRVQRLIERQTIQAIVDTRLASAGNNPAAIRALLKVKDVEPVALTKDGEKSFGEAQQFLVPLAFMILLWISVFTGGQYLLTSTIEEKSNRVMEVLLSAVSPVQLLAGKILGQMSAGLLILLLYSGAGIVGLITFSMTYLLSPLNMLFLIIFFFIAFFTIAAMFAAIGSAVNDIHEAQTLLTPVMLVVMTPMILMMPITTNPSGAFAVVMSFVPPVNPFVMVLRMCSTTPPPLWQVLVSTLLGLAGALVMLKLAAKIFRVGVLMYGKPPNLATLLRWARQA